MRARLTATMTVATALAALTMITGCGRAREADTATPANAAAALAPANTAATTPAGTTDTRTAQQRAEDTFVTATAGHLCHVQSTVYDTPAAMAAAYHTTPTYPSLTPAEVKEFQQRMAHDVALTKRISSTLQQTCKPAS
jgi:hypothetical protein